MKTKLTILSLSLLLFTYSFLLPIQNSAKAAGADSVGTLVVPNAYSGVTGTVTFLGPLANSPRTYQLLIFESELTSLQGKMIDGFTYRLPASATSDWPVSDVTIANYDVYLSGSVDPANRSLTFVNNVTGIQKKVRSGSITFPMNSFTFGGSPNAFGMKISFDSAYLYSGGNLLIEIRHDGYTGTSRSTDAIGTAIPGYGTLFSACWGSGYAATSGSQGNFTVTNISASGLVGVNDFTEIPGSFYLGQNYPNPFNPVTNVEFGIAKSGFVSLVVYNSLGKEVATLVNNTLNAGNYKYDFNASELSSGIYYYTLKVNPNSESADFIQTKKMLLIK